MKDLINIVTWALEHKYATRIEEPDDDTYYIPTTKYTVLIEVPGIEYGPKVHEAITALNLMQTECVVYTEADDNFPPDDPNYRTIVIAHVMTMRDGKPVDSSPRD